MTLSMKSINTKKHKLILTMIVVSVTGLLSMNQSYASSYYSNDREYNDDRQGHHSKKKLRSSGRHGDDYSDSRTHRNNKYRYSKQARKHHRSHNRRGQHYSNRHIHNHYCRSNHSHDYSGHRRNYYPRHHNNENRIESYSTNYNGSITYSTYSSHSDPVATIVGGAIGGAIANDISGGDSAATAFGIVTGAVLAGGFGH